MAKSIYKDNRAIALIVVYMLVVLFAILSYGVFSYISVWATKVSVNRQNWLKALYAAESAIDRGMGMLPRRLGPPPPTVAIPLMSLGTPANSECKGSINEFPSGASSPYTRWRIKGEGFIPSSTAPYRFKAEVEAIVEEDENKSNDFYGKLLYTSTKYEEPVPPDNYYIITVKGESSTIDGYVFYDNDGDIDIPAGAIPPEKIKTGDGIDFSKEAGVIRYDYLRQQAQAQQAIDGYRHVISVDEFDSRLLPSSFWFDEINEIPNIIYVYEGESENDLGLTGNQNLYGFIIVSSGDCDVKGTVDLDGSILVIDDLKISGDLTASGNVWAGDVVPGDETGRGRGRGEEEKKDGIFLNGSLSMGYNEDYNDAIKKLGILNLVRLISWREVRREKFPAD